MSGLNGSSARQLETEVARLQAQVLQLNTALTEAQKLAAKPRWK